jgi:hypothetical protein
MTGEIRIAGQGPNLVLVAAVEEEFIGEDITFTVRSECEEWGVRRRI